MNSNRMVVEFVMEYKMKVVYYKEDVDDVFEDRILNVLIDKQDHINVFRFVSRQKKKKDDEQLSYKVKNKKKKDSSFT